MLISYIKLLRPHQWIKNIILFAGIIFGKKLGDMESIEKAIFAFFLFSLTASCQYVVNDFLDRKEDALHPEKKYRPLASGAISPTIALFFTAILLSVTLVLSFRLQVEFFYLVTGYLIFNIVYSRFLKHMVILDVMSISFGFVIRAIAGSYVVGVSFSYWLLLCTFMLALYWGFGKRRGELIILEDGGKGHRKILEEYSVNFLDLMMGIVATMTLVTYVMYVMSPTTIERLGTDKMVFTIPIVVYAIFRSLYIIYIKNMGHNPTKAILSDIGVLVAGFFWFLLVVWIMYSGPSQSLPIHL